ncbi:MAG: N,N-dimethylformamidase beta subunit family domain-containing protein, partial [Janthinobacterium lividum]
PGLADRTMAVLSEEDGTMTAILSVGPEGAMAAVAGPDGTVTAAIGTPLAVRRWYRIWMSLDPAAGTLLVGQQALELHGHVLTPDAQETVTVTSAGLAIPAGAGPVTIGARAPGPDGDPFTGKIEEPAILAGWVPSIPDPLAVAASFGTVLAAWDFAQGIGGTVVTDVGPQGCHGATVNGPVRAAVGIRWTGRETCWRHAPGDYGAIHFHADDLEDCGWPASLAFTVPDGLRSGCYMLHLICAAGDDWLPFYVLPSRDGPRAPIAFLASTFTYIAYANYARGNADSAYKERVAEWDAYPYNPEDYPAYGVSTYNRHPDGAGVSLSSRLRPILTMRPGFFTFNDPHGSGTRHFIADSHILAWLEDKGFAYDVLTDEDLDDETLGLVQPYAAVLTGTHPEYYTERMLDALLAYTRGGGRLGYLGGNGFYWRIARDPARPHLIEIRRAEGGVRAWAAEPGEYFHQLDGQLGGMWRRSRRPPQQLAGVGFSGQGLFEGTHYRRLPASREPAHAWIFDGVEEDVIGDYGLSGGGAAGFEFDRADRDLGTPDNAVILARSEDPPASAETVLEELLSHLATTTGETKEALVRAEIVYFTTPAGGEVFSTGSITFCGSLWRYGFEGPVSRLLENVVRRFSRPAGQPGHGGEPDTSGTPSVPALPHPPGDYGQA